MPVTFLNTQSMLLSEYLRYVTNETDSPSTVRVRAHFIRRLHQDVDVLTATGADLETWLRSHPWKPATVNVALAAVRHFYRWAERYGHRTENPTRWLRPARVPRHISRVAPDESIKEALATVEPATRLMILLGAECGLRRAEIAKVHRSDIHGEWLYVIGKGGHERVVHLSPEIITLAESLAGAGWLFPNRAGNHITGETVYQRIKRAVGVNPHALRHRAGTVVYRNTGNNLRLTQEFLGHATPQMTAKYVHVTRDDLLLAGAAARIAA